MKEIPDWLWEIHKENEEIHKKKTEIILKYKLEGTAFCLNPEFKTLHQRCEELSIITRDRLYESRRRIITSEIQELMIKREKVRKSKDFVKADNLRNILMSFGIKCEDRFDKTDYMYM